MGYGERPPCTARTGPHGPYVDVGEISPDTVVGLGLMAGFALGVWLPGTPLVRTFTGWRPAAVKSSERLGDEVVAAIERFRAAQGVYPLHLDALIPNYFELVPAPVAGDRHWRYETDRAGTWFKLTFAFDEYDYPCSTYSSESGEWYRDQ